MIERSSIIFKDLLEFERNEKGNEWRWKNFIRKKMAPFHGMALILLGIGYLLHAEPPNGHRTLGTINLKVYNLKNFDFR